MIRRPPRSTLFPTRRSSDLDGGARIARGEHAGARIRAEARVTVVEPEERSEEHTSELQSRLHLVCRLLLEKKKIILFLIIAIIVAIPLPWQGAPGLVRIPGD